MPWNITHLFKKFSLWISLVSQVKDCKSLQRKNCHFYYFSLKRMKNYVSVEKLRIITMRTRGIRCQCLISFSFYFFLLYWGYSSPDIGLLILFIVWYLIYLVFQNLLILNLQFFFSKFKFKEVLIEYTIVDHHYHLWIMFFGIMIWKK